MSFSGHRIKKMLPKTYLRNHVAHEVFAALIHFKSLRPVMDKYVYNDGTTKDLMSLTGTIPVVYQETTYNIPVCVWLEESYPQTAPICYIRPTHEMMVIRGKYVSSNIEVVLPYLQDWEQGKCDLVTLLQVMAAVFGDFPPVCMQPPSQPEQDSCWMQFHKEAELLAKTDGSLYLYLAAADGQPFQQVNETTC